MVNRMKNTGVICILTIADHNREDGYRQIDVGNYFVDDFGNRCLILSQENARKYAHICDVPVYVRIENKTH